MGENPFALGKFHFAFGENVFSLEQFLFAFRETVFDLKQIVFGLWEVEPIVREIVFALGEIVFRLKQLVFGFCEVEFMFKQFVCHRDVTERRSKMIESFDFQIPILCAVIRRQSRGFQIANSLQKIRNSTHAHFFRF